MTLRICVVLLLLGSSPLTGYSREAPEGPSAGKAFALSLLAPGLGQRYANEGNWDGSATVFALADAALWAGLGIGLWRQDQLVQSYETLAAGRANAETSGKDRTFFLNLAGFRSSDEYLEVMLRQRAWDRLDYVSDPSYQWEWQTEEDFERFRALREDAESYRRRAPVFAALLVGNRLISGILAARSAARRTDTALDLRLTAPARHGEKPGVYLALRW